MNKQQTPPSLYLIEHNALAVSSLRRLLGKRRVQVLDYSDPFSFAMATQSPLIIVDTTTLGMAADKFIPLLRTRCPTARVLVIAESTSDELLCRLLQCGVQGFLRYDELDNFQSAIRSIANGRLWVKPRVFELYVRHTAHCCGPRKTFFTARELEILPLVVAKLSNKEISTAINISTRTVKFHLANICRKLGVRSRQEVAQAVQCSGTQTFQSTAIEAPILVRNRTEEAVG